MKKQLSDLYSERQGKYVKQATKEDFLLGMNHSLRELESSLYESHEIKHPFIFVFGPPRSGTTLITQVIAHSFNLGYINNFMARFWLAPIHGIRLSRIIYGDSKLTDFKSDYAATSELTDIHEFGYFWRHWLLKESFKGVTKCKEIESDIDWMGLKKVLGNIQNEFKGPMVYKNIFGSYHLKKMKESLDKVIYVYITRDSLDTAISILDARKKYYSDLNTWWSYMPVEYEQLKDKNYWEQITGQVFYLKRYYEGEIQKNKLDNVVQVSMKELSQSPKKVLEKINLLSKKLYDYNMKIENQPPQEFPFRTYTERNEEKEKFEFYLNKFKNKDSL